MPGEFVDTNIVIYSLSQDDKKQDKALALLANKPIAQHFIRKICSMDKLLIIG